MKEQLLREKIVLITGFTSGIGFETALAIAKLDAKLILVARNQKKAEKALKRIINKTGNHKIDVMICDLSLLSEVRRISDQIKSKYPRIDILINNAGVMEFDYVLTKEGFELNWAVNYLAPALLTIKLQPLLKKSAAARVINVSSNAHQMSKFDLNIPQIKHVFLGFRTYSFTKLCLVMFGYTLQQKLKNTNITINSLHPGVVATNLFNQTGLEGLIARLFLFFAKPFMVSPRDGAQTSIYLATSPKVEQVGGKYFSGSVETASSALSHDLTKQTELWEYTIRTLNLTETEVI